MRGVIEPTEAKRLRGNPSNQKLNEREPKPPKPILPAYPAHLPSEGKATWYDVGSYLLEYGFITTSDVQALIDYVELDLLNRKLTKLIQRAPPIIKGKSTEKKNPIWTLKLEYIKERRAQHIQFGMTPAARSRIISTLEEEDELESALH